MRARRVAPAAALLAPFLLLGACPGETPPPEEEGPPPLPRLEASVLDAIDPARMRDDVDFLADEALGGRIPGSIGHATARDWLVGRLDAIGLEPLGDDGDFPFAYTHAEIGGRWQLDANGEVEANRRTDGVDLVGLLPGSDPLRADEYVVLVAHYDHLGVTQTGDAYNGAFDDAAGVAMLLELARVLVAQDAAPPRSTVFLISDDEESGLLGAEAWAAAPTVPLGDVVAVLSVDPVGRPMLPDYSPTVLIGPERSPAFLSLLQRMAPWSEQPVVFVQRELVRNFGSDQDAFHAAETPTTATWLVNPGMAFYHQPDDTAETIDYRTLLRTARWTAEVVNVLGRDDARYPYEGPPPLDGKSAQGAQDLIAGMLDSEHLTAAERKRAESIFWTLQGVIEANDLNELDNPDVFIAEALIFVLFELPQAHPGQIPPPFPAR